MKERVYDPNKIVQPNERNVPSAKDLIPIRVGHGCMGNHSDYKL